MTIEYVCDYCEFIGNREDYYQHIEVSAKCDTRDECCKLKEISDYEQLEQDEICDNCTKILNEYWEDFWTEGLMESYYEG
jgi:hypothetical protein